MVTAGSERAYESVPKLLRNLGVLVCIGIPRLDFHVPISPFEIIVRGKLRCEGRLGKQWQLTRYRFESCGNFRWYGKRDSRAAENDRRRES